MEFFVNALAKSASVKLELLKFAELIRAPRKDARKKFPSANVAPLMTISLKSAPVKSDLLKSTPARYVPENDDPAKLVS